MNIQSQAYRINIFAILHMHVYYAYYDCYFNSQTCTLTYTFLFSMYIDI